MADPWDDPDRLLRGAMWVNSIQSAGSTAPDGTPFLVLRLGGRGLDGGRHRTWVAVLDVEAVEELMTQLPKILREAAELPGTRR